MPRQNKTGPMGYGPMTGRGMGLCGMGYNRGRGCGKWTYQPLSSKDEKEMLLDESKMLEDELKSIKSRIQELN